MYKISFKRTAEQAPVMYAAGGNVDCLLDYHASGKPFIAGYDYAMSLNGNTAIWMQTASTRYLAEYGVLEKVGISNAASLHEAPEGYDSVNRELAPDIVAGHYDFFRALLKERQSMADVERFIQFVSNDDTSSLYRVVFDNFSDHGIYYAVPLLRRSFLNCIITAQKESAGDKDAKIAQGFLNRVCAIIGATTKDEAERLDTRVGLTFNGFKGVAPYVCQSSFDTQAGSEDKVLSAVINLRLLTMFVPLARYGDDVLSYIQELVSSNTRMRRHTDQTGDDLLSIFI